MAPSPFARGYIATTPLATRRGEWGWIAELRRADCRIRQIHVLPPGTPARHRRLLALYDVAATIGAAAGLLCAVALNVSWPPALLAFVLVGGIAARAGAGRLTAEIRGTIRTLTVTSWTGEIDRATVSDRALMDRCAALAERIDTTPRHSPLARELLWGELYFLLPTGERITPIRTR